MPRRPSRARSPYLVVRHLPRSARTARARLLYGAPASYRCHGDATGNPALCLALGSAADWPSLLEPSGRWRSAPAQCLQVSAWAA